MKPRRVPKIAEASSSTSKIPTQPYPSNGPGSLFRRADGGTWYASRYYARGKRKERETARTRASDNDNERRFLSVDEWRRLRATTKHGPERRVIAGNARHLLHEPPIQTRLPSGV